METQMTSTLTTIEFAGLSEADFKQAQLYLTQTREGLLGSVKLTTQLQWQFKPAVERWSIAEIIEHVILVQERVLGRIRQDLATAPAPPPHQDCTVVDSIIVSQFPNRLSKFPSPIPATVQLDKAAAVGRYCDNCDTFAKLLTTTDGLRDHAFESVPLRAISKEVYSVMDGYQLILAGAAHAERHTKQILEVIADPAFPV
jgi:hypothetical protein